MKCIHCKTPNNLAINSKRITNGKQFTYYMCRKCNTERHVRYRETEVGKENSLKAAYKSSYKYWNKTLARANLRYHLEQGHIKRPEVCSECGKGSTYIAGHHKDYYKPLEVDWYCRGCHADEHGRLSVLK